MSAELSQKARRLAAALEPFAGQVYFSPEAHAEYVKLGFQPSPAAIGDPGVAMPDGPAYFTSRGSVMGQVPGELIASAFAVFNPAAVVPSVTFGWTLTDAETICAARDRGAVAQLERILGEKPDGIDDVGNWFEKACAPLRPEGRPLFAGLLSQRIPESPVGRAWRFADMLREYRGDAHTASWISEGIDATEICLLTDLYWNLPMRSYSRSRAWSDEQFDAAADRLRSRGLLDGDSYSDAGRALREQIETNTDAQMQSAVAALGDELATLCSVLEGWGKQIRAAAGYLSGGPDSLANAR
jgi:helix-turn-helix protein